MNRFQKAIRIFSILLCYHCHADAQAPAKVVKLNQLGFYIKAPKIAVMTKDSITGSFYVVSDKGDTAFKGLLSEIRQSANSSLKTRIADFSALQKTGNYFIAVPGIENSYFFHMRSIGNIPKMSQFEIVMQDCTFPF